MTLISGKDDFKSEEISSVLLPEDIRDSVVLPSINQNVKQKLVRLPSQDDLWKSIESNYIFLMDDFLVQECNKTKDEFWSHTPPRSPPTSRRQQPISFPEFKDRFNALHDHLHLLQTGALENQGVVLQNQGFGQELAILSEEYAFLLDQSTILPRLDSEIKREVSWRATVLKNKWSCLKEVIRDKSDEPKSKKEKKSLQVEARQLRKWLRSVEERLRAIKASRDLPLKTIRVFLYEGKLLQQEIEARGPQIHSLLRRCGTSPAGGSTAACSSRRRARHLEKTWHSLWIRSLENQCLAEQLLGGGRVAQAQNSKDSAEADPDEGPLSKQPRLTADQCPAARRTMSALRRDQGLLRTKDVGVLCKRVSASDKGVMVGATSIAALKAEYGDDFTNFEIIQDVGYSSESSTHLSGDDCTADRPFSVRIYKYNPKDPQTLSLRDELAAVVDSKSFFHLSSSLDSSSSASASLHDSGLGTGEVASTGESRNGLELLNGEADFDQEDADYLETVLDECGDFDVGAGNSGPEELHFNLSGIDSDDLSDSFHNRSSFNTSAQMFYKMISVDSDNGEADSFPVDNATDAASPKDICEGPPQDASSFDLNCNDLRNTSDVTITNRSALDLDDANNNGLDDRQPELTTTTRRQFCCSTPVKSGGLKRKHGHDVLDGATMSRRINAWLRRCSLELAADSGRAWTPPRRQRRVDASSCDASCECTSSSADDEGNACSSTASVLDDFPLSKARTDSCSAEESAGTNVLDVEYALLPPPPSSSASCVSGGVCRARKDELKMYKSASDGDVRSRDAHGAFDSSSHPMPNGLQPVLRCCSSLPAVHRVVRSESSADDNCCSSGHRLLSNSDSRTTPCCATGRSTSSEVGRRRRRSRKKSSSSNRSSASGHWSTCDNRRRSRNSSVRRRYLSQRSEISFPEVFSDEEVPLLKVDIPAVEEDPAFCDVHRCVSSALLSPVESDVILTNLEEQSTVSDQVWDGYQEEMPYLSEGCSEAAVDEEALRKLTEFGDDYGLAIGQPSRILDPRTPIGKCKGDSPKKASKNISQRESDSESEDLQYIIEESEKAIHFARNTLKKKESLSPADIAELLATCSTHLNCLQSICDQIQSKGKELNFSASDLSKLYDLIEDWQAVRRSTAMLEESKDPVRQSFLKVQAGVDHLFHKMTALAADTSSVRADHVASWEDLEKKLARLKMVLTSLQETKEQLIAVNLQVHRFTTRHGSESEYKECSLKSDITELYRRWEDICEKRGQQVHDLEIIRTDWRNFNEKLCTLQQSLRKAEELHLSNTCDKSCPLCEEGSQAFKRDLVQLELEEASLKARLQDEDLWGTADETLLGLRKRLRTANTDPPVTSFPSANRRGRSTAVESDADDHFEDAIQRLCDAGPKETSPPGKKKSSRLWRIFRLAVPVQVALVLLYCLACYFEPSCCNALNNYNFSFTPQLRYFGGRPPV